MTERGPIIMPDLYRQAPKRGPIVWIVMTENSKKDFSPAREYGDFRVVFPRPIYNDEFRDPVAEATRFMEDYQDGDSILVSGDHMATGIVFEVALSLSETQKLNILRWDRRTLTYVPYELNFS